MILKTEFFFIVIISELSFLKFLIDFFEKLHPPLILHDSRQKKMCRVNYNQTRYSNILVVQIMSFSSLLINLLSFLVFGQTAGQKNLF